MHRINWRRRKGLQINAKKACCIIFTSLQRHVPGSPSIRISNSILVASDHTKFLGAELDKHSKVYIHIFALTKKVACGVDSPHLSLVCLYSVILLHFLLG